jgi:hypothetical protein
LSLLRLSMRGQEARAGFTADSNPPPLPPCRPRGSGAAATRTTRPPAPKTRRRRATAPGRTLAGMTRSPAPPTRPCRATAPGHAATRALSTRPPHATRLQWRWVPTAQASAPAGRTPVLPTSCPRAPRPRIASAHVVPAAASPTLSVPAGLGAVAPPPLWAKRHRGPVP